MSDEVVKALPGLDALVAKEANAIRLGKAISFERVLRDYGTSRAAVAAGYVPMQEHAHFWLPGEAI
jgi:hypothetical protein